LLAASIDVPGVKIHEQVPFTHKYLDPGRQRTHLCAAADAGERL